MAITTSIPSSIPTHFQTTTQEAQDIAPLLVPKLGDSLHVWSLSTSENQNLNYQPNHCRIYLSSQRPRVSSSTHPLQAWLVLWDAQKLGCPGFIYLCHRSDAVLVLVISLQFLPINHVMCHASIAFSSYWTTSYTVNQRGTFVVIFQVHLVVFQATDQFQLPVCSDIIFVLLFITVYCVQKWHFTFKFYILLGALGCRVTSIPS
jgi:hypothetical protein